MTPNRLNQIDLKLLQALQVLIEEGSVTRAAERLHITQPAMSKTLQKLRDTLNDPLFTRTGQGLIPTPKTQQLSLRLPELLQQLYALVSEEGFNPAESRARFRIATVEMVSFTFFSPLVQSLFPMAPNMQIIESTLGDSYLDDLASGKLDFTVHLTTSCPDGFHATPLASATAGCMMREDHPLSAITQMSMEDYLHYPHVRVYFSRMTLNDVGFVDQLLASIGKRRHIMFETTHVNTAIDILRNTDCLMVGSLFSTSPNPASYGVCERPFPTEIDFPELQFALIQHERTLNSPAHNWLKQQIVKSASHHMLKPHNLDPYTKKARD
jgi:DNA-binding transcriptional LysR family regulator